MQILIVEDEAILALMVAEALTMFGYKVLGPAHTVEEALQVAARERSISLLLISTLLGAMKALCWQESCVNATALKLYS
jgi:DNA-binding response OmpR family regulator